MQIVNIKDFINGWIIGHFDPSLYKTDLFEIAVKYYKKGESEKRHYHKVATEYTVIVSGQVKMNDRIFNEKDIIVIEKGESTDFIPLTDAITCVIKIPSVKGDKYE